MHSPPGQLMILFQRSSKRNRNSRNRGLFQQSSFAEEELQELSLVSHSRRDGPSSLDKISKSLSWRAERSRYTQRSGRLRIKSIENSRIRELML